MRLLISFKKNVTYNESNKIKITTVYWLGEFIDSKQGS